MGLTYNVDLTVERKCPAYGAGVEGQRNICHFYIAIPYSYVYTSEFYPQSVLASTEFC